LIRDRKAIWLVKQDPNAVYSCGTPITYRCAAEKSMVSSRSSSSRRAAAEYLISAAAKNLLQRFFGTFSSCRKIGCS